MYPELSKFDGERALSLRQLKKKILILLVVHVTQAPASARLQQTRQKKAKDPSQNWKNAATGVKASKFWWQFLS